MTHDPMRQADIARRLTNLAKARRCGAKTRAGHPCRQAAVKGRTRCRMHGGAKGSGGPRGNRISSTGSIRTRPNLFIEPCEQRLGRSKRSSTNVNRLGRIERPPVKTSYDATPPPEIGRGRDCYCEGGRSRAGWKGERFESPSGMNAAYLAKLNPQQRRAVEHGGPSLLDATALLIIAGAGSGKTNTLDAPRRAPDRRRDRPTTHHVADLLPTRGRRDAEAGRAHHIRGARTERACARRQHELVRHVPCDRR
jgi:hypothetical protein